MTDIETFLAYAAAFETAYDGDDWTAVRGFFADDAVYEVDSTGPFAGTWKGGDAIVEHLVESVNTFDRTYDERALDVVEGPVMKDGAVWMRWSVVYRKAGRPDLRVEGVEEARIRDGKIVHLKDGMP